MEYQKLYLYSMVGKSFVAKHLLNNKIILNEDYLKRSIKAGLETGLIKPINISRTDFLISVQNKIRNSTLVAHEASLLFSFRGKKYLLIYNK